MSWNPYSVDELSRNLNGLTDWFLDGGYSLELFLGNVSRVHGDIDVGIFSRDAKTFLKNLVSMGYEVHIANKELALFNESEFDEEDYNYWISDIKGYRFQVLVYRLENGGVHFRRNKGVVWPEQHFLISKNGINIVNPLVTYAFKVTTKSVEEKDLSDIASFSDWVASNA